MQRRNKDGQDGDPHEAAKAAIKMKATGKKGIEKGNCLEEIQKQVEVAAKSITFLHQSNVEHVQKPTLQKK